MAEAYADLGVPARYRPVNDVITAAGRKISGTGAAEIGDFVVLVGNLIADFDYDTMVRVLRVPDEKFRDKVFQSMRENLTTLRRETGRTFTLGRDGRGARSGGSRRCSAPSSRPQLPAAVRAEADRLAPRFLGEEWLSHEGQAPPAGPRRANRRRVSTCVQRVHKAPGGLLRATLESGTAAWSRSPCRGTSSATRRTRSVGWNGN